MPGHLEESISGAGSLRLEDEEDERVNIGCLDGEEENGRKLLATDDDCSRDRRRLISTDNASRNLCVDGDEEAIPGIDARSFGLAPESAEAALEVLRAEAQGE